ncbi:hypothetical protein L6250_01415 [Candidatus Parcubacteria bacterium]|nr:hypothetical protein [Patescibacteria group bacterium]MCG2688274.1 hypothetical protein [Candidatus Parcubacteria bacterium]
MTKRKRTVLFFTCLISFLVIAPLIVLYSQGYRLDPRNRTITKTGAFYIKASPKNCDVFIDGKLVSKTDFLFGTDLIENLIPGTYLMEIGKQGYIPWQKNLKIKAMMTTEAKNIVLFPQNLALQNNTSNVNRIFPIPSNKKLILEKKDSQGWYLTSFDLKNSLEEILFLEKDFDKKGLGSNLEDLIWSDDSKKAIAKISINETEKFFLINIENKISPISLDPLGNFEKISFQANDSSKFLISKMSTLYSGDFASLKTIKLIDNIIDFTIADNKLYFLDGNGFVTRIDDLESFSGQKLSDTPFTIMPENFYELKAEHRHLFLKQKDLLFWFNQQENAFVKIANNATDLTVSQDNGKLAYLNNTEISVYFFKEKIEQIEEREPDQNMLLGRFSEKIGQVFWLNNDYLLFTVGNKLKVAEIDNRDQANIIDLAEINNPQIYFNKDNKKASVLSQGNLLTSNPILP